MCGIAGTAVFGRGTPPGPSEIEAMCATLHHRGPDDQGTWIGAGVALGMRRLAIIDVEGGKQPYLNEDGSVIAVFNGEIYNFAELRAGLEARGHRLRSRADGEVLVHLYEEHGLDFPCRLNGMFAIALFDERRNRLVLVRDRVGIKPLFYALSDRELVFGSEVKALLASGRLERTLDLDALAEFLTWEYVPAPRTLLRGVSKLEPGSSLEVDLAHGHARKRTWWDVPPARSEEKKPDEEWEEEVDARLKECVRRELVSDVPLGAFLSGGVDSSLVVAAMGEARTFSIGFDDPSYSELEWSKRVARHLGVSHRTEVLKPQVEELFLRLMHFMDDPIADFSIFPTYLVSRLAREEVTVVLSGDGGDEIFGGYETYVAEKMAALWNRLPLWLRKRVLEPLAERLRPRPKKKGLVNKFKRFVEGAAHPEDLHHARWRLFLGDSLRRCLFTPEAQAAFSVPAEAHIRELFHRAGDRRPLDACLYVDLKSYLTDNCLVKVDRMSMACSLEARVPLLDHELVELAFRLPPHLKVKNGHTKVLLKRLAARKVPPECVYREKQGFSIPIKNWLRESLRPLLETRLSPERLAAQGLFDGAVVERLKREHFAGQANHSHILWALVVAQEWMDRWLKRAAVVEGAGTKDAPRS